MSRETSPYVVGDFWLDKRRDGHSPEVWQIARYAKKSRSVVYRSTKCRLLEDAKAVIHGHDERERARKPQTAEAALVVPQLLLYWKEHGSEAIRSPVIAGSLRAFIGFLMQDEIGDAATIADLNGPVFDRFRRWRMGPHAYNVPWAGKDFPHRSGGVSGETVQRNLDDVRAGLNHAARAGRIPYAPKVPSVPSIMRSPARDVRVTLEQLAAMVGFASQTERETKDGDDPDPNRSFRRWLLLMIATACRPDAALAFDPREQWRGDLLDMHPLGHPRTKKRNPVVPAIEPFKPVLEAWRADNRPAAVSRKTAWRTMRRALGLPENVVPKTIRHTIATELRSRGVPAEQIAGLLGHVAMGRITEVYAKYDPAYLREAKAALTSIFETVLRRGEKWSADHRRTKAGRSKVIVVAREPDKV